MGKIAHPNLSWSEVPFFLALGRHTTLSAAGAALGADRTTVARRIDALEARLNRALFDRTDGSFQLTHHGRALFAAAERAEQELRALDPQAHAAQHSAGKVRVTVPEQFVMTLAQWQRSFVADHPDILLETSARDQISALARFEADIALRISPSAPADLHAVKLGAVAFGLYAAADLSAPTQAYITHPGRPEPPDWVRALMPDAQVVLSIDGYTAMREAIAAGIGAGVLPCRLGRADHRLHEMGVVDVGTPFFYWLLCLPEQRNLHRIRATMRHLRRSWDQFQTAPPPPGPPSQSR
ncbi:LysR family transcriptional regulator [Yoonia sp. R2331]|uniref:LysR family transcriptional regulator n=1 Tax=Yoonia sp. R2331 TaxID=3237238 RepID=UPI0034E4E365